MRVATRGQTYFGVPDFEDELVDLVGVGEEVLVPLGFATTA